MNALTPVHEISWSQRTEKSRHNVVVMFLALQMLLACCAVAFDGFVFSKYGSPLVRICLGIAISTVATSLLTIIIMGAKGSAHPGCLLLTTTLKWSSWVGFSVMHGVLVFRSCPGGQACAILYTQFGIGLVQVLILMGTVFMAVSLMRFRRRNVQTVVKV